ncbi:hypothetical protein B566_EDAN005141 [Ephemera danica]|nr:hypothetical protein B566_EDAN005141 [Ephemera danica]
MTSGFSTSIDHLTIDNVSVAPSDPTLDADLERVYELDRCARWLNETNVSRACLQFPDSNLVDSVTVSQRLQEKVASSSIYILGDTSYGRCVSVWQAPAVSEDELCSLLSVNRTGHVINTKLLTGEQGQHASQSSSGPCNRHCRLDVENRHQVACLGRGFCLPDGVCIENCHTVYVGEDSSLLHCLFLSILGSNLSLKAFSPLGQLFSPSLAVSLLRRQQQYKVQCVREASTIGVVLACPGDPSLLPAVKYIRHLVATKQSPPRIYVLAIGKPNPAKLSNFPEEADVSLLTGRLVNLKHSAAHLDEQSGTLAEKSSGQIIEPGQAGLVGRSWRGLDPALGQHMPVFATEGRSGIAAHYDSEPTDS